MAKSKIISVGFEISSSDVEYCHFESEKSLLDWDLILFRPDISNFVDYSSLYKGKPALSDSMSFRLKRSSEHWKREIKDCVEAGKLVIVFLCELEQVYIATGDKSYSGTGKNRHTTRIVAEFDNYQCIPIDLKPVSRTGKAIKLAPHGAEIISAYWAEFSSLSEYKVALDSEIPASLLTNHGNKVVGSIIKSGQNNGAIILLPDIDFHKPEFFEEIETDEGYEAIWTEKATEFASRLIKSVVPISSALRDNAEITPEPDWATANVYSLDKESKLIESISKIDKKIDELQSKKNLFTTEYKKHGKLRALLYETGKPLEHAIIDALKILGFSAEGYEDGKSEFDAVFESNEGRLIGEAEGKDNKAINVTKLRQLALNIHEDLERDEVNVPAKGVLFGNPFRLTPISDRDSPFTDKCLTAAVTSSTALVFTPDLFSVARYLSNHADVNYAKKCRQIIASTTGRVVFPDIPEKGRDNNNTAVQEESR